MTEAATLSTYPPHLQHMTWYENYLNSMHQFDAEELDDEEVDNELAANLHDASWSEEVLESNTWYENYLGNMRQFDAEELDDQEVDNGLAANRHDTAWQEAVVESKPEHDFVIDQFSTERSDDKVDQQIGMLSDFILDRINRVNAISVCIWKNSMSYLRLWDANGCEAAAVLHDNLAVDALLETHSLLDCSTAQKAEDAADAEPIMHEADWEIVLQDPKLPAAVVEPKQDNHLDLDCFLAKMANENVNRQFSDASTAASETAASEDESIEG
mmetsp:Transcript_126937/g.201289  ORF Transcript_126937/g.201289 Transcript_126937/m.201289 type:complete len:271 (-) Transcript_126937:125-937(-)